MKYLLSTIVLCVTFVTLFAQFPNRPKPKVEPTQQEDEILKPENKDDSKTIKNNTSKKTSENSIKAAIVEERFRRLDIVGLHIERAMSDKSTIAISPGIEFLFLYNDGGPSPRLGVGLLPKIDFSYRYYYNLEQRKSRNKPYLNNSACYLSGKFVLQALLENSLTNNHAIAFSIGPVWGVQSYKGKVSVNFEIGPGLVILLTENAYGPTILGKFKFGFIR